jgi:hypothetical protein
MFRLILTSKSPKEPIFSGHSQPRTCLCVPPMHLVLGVTRYHKYCITFIFSQLIENVQYIRHRLLLGAVAIRSVTLHGDYTVLINDYQPVDRPFVVLFYVAKFELLECLSGFDQLEV